MTDYINPDHYDAHRIGGATCIDLTAHMTFMAGNAVKYLWRAGRKPGEDAAKDLAKAIRYIEFMEERRQVPVWHGKYAPAWFFHWERAVMTDGDSLGADILDLIEFLSCGEYRSARTLIEGIINAKETANAH